MVWLPDVLLALRKHMARPLADGVDIGQATRSFDVRPCLHLRNAKERVPGNADRKYLEMERE